MSHNGQKDLPKLSFTVEWVTPAMAATMLGTMETNRRTRRRAIERFAREIIAGKWKVNGETIVLTRSGKVKDGQHRLQGVILAKTAAPMIIVRGIEDDHDTAMTIDTGTTRNFADVVQLEGGGPRGGEMASVARWYWRYENGTLSSRGNLTLSHHELAYIIEKHPQVDNAVVRIDKSPFRKHAPRSVLGFVYAWLTENVDGDTAELFLMELERGTNLEETNPVYLLRRRLIEYDQRYEPHTVLALIIKTYNAWIEGSPLKILSWKPSTEGFPQFGKIERHTSFQRKRRARLAAAEGGEVTA